jgi:succinylglutamate desuccinylase
LIESNQAVVNDHLIDIVEGVSDGPTLILLSGVHGNEIAGVRAVSSVLNRVNRIKSHLKGKLVGVKCNLNAIRQNLRYVDEDMNRLWFPSIIQKVRQTPDSDLESSERRELKHVIETLVRLRKEAGTPLIFIDVHTFSSDGWMFALANDDPALQNLLSEIKIPKVYGIIDALRGTALGYFKQQGLLSLGIEGGQHDAESTEYNIKAALMLLLEAAGCIEAGLLPEVEEYRSHLKNHMQHLPEETELVYQHIIEPGDDFKMRPGYTNFQAIKKGEWLADDREGRIIAEIDGYVLMPLYQEQGNDGFFLIKEHEAE